MDDLQAIKSGRKELTQFSGLVINDQKKKEVLRSN